jgi:hypothetical protein
MLLGALESMYNCVWTMNEHAPHQLWLGEWVNIEIAMIDVESNCKSPNFNVGSVRGAGSMR